MKDQHKLISGYRDLSQDEIDLMNKVKALGPLLQEVVDELAERAKPDSLSNVRPDPRWVSIGRTHLQEGLMALTRSVARPEFF